MSKFLCSWHFLSYRVQVKGVCAKTWVFIQAWIFIQNFKIPITILSLLNLLRATSRIGHSYWKLLGRWDSCLVLLSLAQLGRDEQLLLGQPLHRRSFRNGVGMGIKKTSTRRAKS
uniref:Uncharacterized protein n=1 Tax=Catharus ustulatus TaxID=91951 RepID=A0A8C3UGS1_CATUS